MKLIITKFGKNYKAIVNQGVQYFTIADSDDEEHVKFIAKMFRKAIKAHNSDIIQKLITKVE